MTDFELPKTTEEQLCMLMLAHAAFSEKTENRTGIQIMSMLEPFFGKEMILDCMKKLTGKI